MNHASPKLEDSARAVHSRSEEDMRGRLEPLLRTKFGIATNIRSHQPIKPNVVRVGLSGPQGTPKSVIIKRARPARAAPVSGASAPIGPEFAEEAVNYRFLETLRPAFSRFPRLLARDDGLIVLEDLGERGHMPDPPGGLADLVVETLARLHAATSDLRDRHADMRRDAGLAGDLRMYSFEQYRRLFEIGSDVFIGLVGAAGVDAAPCRSLLIEAERLMTDRSGPQVFLHDDVISARQLILMNGECRILDFEMGKFGHPLLDISRCLAGKFDRKAGTSSYFLKHLDASASLAERYRGRLATLGGPVFDDGQWDQAYGAAMIFTSVINLGAQLCTPPMVTAMDGNERTRSRLLTRLHDLVGHNRTFSPITDALAALADSAVATRQ